MTVNYSDHQISSDLQILDFQIHLASKGWAKQPLTQPLTQPSFQHLGEQNAILHRYPAVLSKLGWKTLLHLYLALVPARLSHHPPSSAPKQAVQDSDKAVIRGNPSVSPSQVTCCQSVTYTLRDCHVHESWGWFSPPARTFVTS